MTQTQWARGSCRTVRAMRISATLALVLIVLSGRVLDRTTGQPLPGVRVSASSGSSATSDAAGRYVLIGLHGPTVTLTLESDDVPPQRIDVRLKAPRTSRDLRACSTTLDYRCGAPAPSDASGGGGAG